MLLCGAGGSACRSRRREIPGETFEMKTLRTMIEIQARCTDEDLKRLKLIR